MGIFIWQSCNSLHLLPVLLFQFLLRFAVLLLAFAGILLRVTFVFVLLQLLLLYRLVLCGQQDVRWTGRSSAVIRIFLGLQGENKREVSEPDPFYNVSSPLDSYLLDYLRYQLDFHCTTLDFQFFLVVRFG